MKQCRRCGADSPEVIRESIVRRGPRSYLVCWYRCGACQDVSFGYRLFPESTAGEQREESRDSERVATSAAEPPNSDTPLSV